MKVLVIDIGGNHVKVYAPDQNEPLMIDSGPKLTPKQMLSAIQQKSGDWKFDAVSIGYPGPVVDGKPAREPFNLGKGWVGFDFGKAFKCPVKIVNDAGMQALGHYQSGRMLFLGLGTGLGSALIVDGVLHAMELGHLQYKSKIYEYYVGAAALKRYGQKKWSRKVLKIVDQLKDALQAEHVVVGGGNAKRLPKLPPYATLGDNQDARVGGIRLWAEQPSVTRPSVSRSA